MANAGSPAVDVQHVAFSFRSLQVFRDLTLTVPKGVAYGLLGPNGSGKSTLFRMLVGRLRPHQGSIRVLGEEPAPALTARIGYMPQAMALYPELSAAENIDFFARMYGLSDGAKRRKQVAAVLEVVGLADRGKSTVMTLSGGMRQRVSLACALVHEPDLLILDEPTVGLDPELRASFWEHFGSLAVSGKALLISSHTMDDAAHCGRLAFLRGGGIIAEGTPAQLLQEAKAATLEDAFLFFSRRK